MQLCEKELESDNVKLREIRKLNESGHQTSIITTKANIIPDYKAGTLTVELYSLSNPRDNKAAIDICQILNDTQTVFQGTNLRLIYKFATSETTRSQEFWH